MVKEKAIFKMSGDFAYLGSGAMSVTKFRWKSIKVYLTLNHLFILQDSEKETIPLDSITGIGRDISTTIKMSPESYVSVDYFQDGRSFLIAIKGTKEELKKLKKCVHHLKLNNITTFILHPAKIGGVIQDGVKWKKRILTFSKGNIRNKETDILVFKRKELKDIEIYLNNIIQVNDEKQKIGGSLRDVMDIEHIIGVDTYNTYVFTENLNPLMEYLNDYIYDNRNDMRRM